MAPVDGVPSTLAPIAESERRGPLEDDPNSSASNLATPPQSPAGPHQPKRSSLNDILRENSRHRLFVRPWKWTSRHLRLLDCRFLLEKGERKSEVMDTESSVQDGLTISQQQKRPGHLSSEEVATAIDHLSCDSHRLRLSAIGLLLSDHGFHQRPCSNLYFYFHQRIVTTLRIDGLFSFPSSRSDIPPLAYLDLKKLRSRGEMLVVPSASRRPNPPVARLRLKHQRRFRPANEIEDPYIVAVLVALAQKRQQYRFRNLAADLKVHVLVLPTDAQRFFFYTARFSAPFLNRFDQPSKYFPGDPLCISYCSIPFAPIADTIRGMEKAMSIVPDNGQREQPSEDNHEEF
ncbi:uncharacterized protein B0H64DRAFT_462295 [Chaetomium fimeti]|uniref:Uncharacterized protein n=1 Tax=Chaetomium fimeti TaxID=1854472 RepID=A0AAE0LQP3_9PEZI|nr:hypothetical protein B0H64DRAFT_462295 [Chaetomium fimeti]